MPRLRRRHRCTSSTPAGKPSCLASPAACPSPAQPSPAVCLAAWLTAGLGVSSTPMAMIASRPLLTRETVMKEMLMAAFANSEDTAAMMPGWSVWRTSTTSPCRQARQGRVGDA